MSTDPWASMDQPIFPDYPPTIPQVWANACRKFGGNEFLVAGDRTWTYAEADRQSAELARGMLAMGIGKGTRVGMLMPNTPDWVLAWLAAARVGALIVGISTLYQPRELAWVVAHADIDTLLVNSEYAGHDYLE